MTAASPVAIVTAASKGMGAAIARELAGRGYRLALMARSEGINALASELGGVALQGSVIELKDLERLVALAQERYGRVDAWTRSSTTRAILRRAICSRSPIPTGISASTWCS
jgi:NADP-dependent 3-hydroxy acid dehydrogenase YdfG